MSMQSYGSWGLTLDMNKARKAASDEFKAFEIEMEKDDNLEMNISSWEIEPDLEKTMEAFANKILMTMEVGIYPPYISSEAEGTCFAGEVVWMIEVQYSPEVNNAIDDEITWSEYS